MASLTSVVGDGSNRGNCVTRLQPVAGEARLLYMVAEFLKQQEKVSFNAESLFKSLVSHLLFSLAKPKVRIPKLLGVRREILKTIWNRG